MRARARNETGYTVCTAFVLPITDGKSVKPRGVAPGDAKNGAQTEGGGSTEIS